MTYKFLLTQRRNLLVLSFLFCFGLSQGQSKDSIDVKVSRFLKHASRNVPQALMDLETMDSLVFNSSFDTLKAKFIYSKITLYAMMRNFDSIHSLSHQLAEFSQSKKLNDYYLYAHSMDGYAYLGEKRYKKAIEPLKISTQLNNKHYKTDAYRKLIGAYYFNEQYDSALMAIEEVKAFKTDNLHFMLIYGLEGKCYNKLNQKDKAINCFRKAEALHQQFGDKYDKRKEVYNYAKALYDLYYERQHDSANYFAQLCLTKRDSLILKDFEKSIDHVNLNGYYLASQQEKQTLKVTIALEKQKTLVAYALFTIVLVILLATILLLLKQRKANQVIQLKNEALAESNQTITQLGNIKNVLLNNLSHELKTPLHAIMGIITLWKYKQAELFPENTEELQIIDQSSKQMFHFINDLIEFYDDDLSIIGKEESFTTTGIINLLSSAVDHYRSLNQNKFDIQFEKEQEIQFKSNLYQMIKLIFKMMYLMDRVSKQQTLNIRGQFSEKHIRFSMLSPQIHLDQNTIDLVHRLKNEDADLLGSLDYENDNKFFVGLIQLKNLVHKSGHQLAFNIIDNTRLSFDLEWWLKQH